MPGASIDPYFTAFESAVGLDLLPAKFSLMTTKPHPLCLLAANQLQSYLINQKDWVHNFGLSDQDEGTVIGKMFGVLVVQNNSSEIGYLSAFSGKLAGSNQHRQFVPPVFDLLTENGFLNVGMEELTRMNLLIRTLEEEHQPVQNPEIIRLKAARKAFSIALQDEIFEHYHFLNQAGDEKSLISIFNDAGYKKPPAGAGECAAPKLLQYAFAHEMRPVALAEFWWGQSPKSDFWKHGHFYECCKEKCEPIFRHTLAGIDVEKP